MTPPVEPKPLPDSCGVAFKEWAGVCEALETGRQSIILRKGGIDEGPSGFTPEHHAFWLYPTRVHQEQQGLKEGAAGLRGSEPDASKIALSALAVVEFVANVGQVERLLGDMDRYHVWTSETVMKRFLYRRPGLWALGVRVYRRPEPINIAVTPEQAGCKTWVPLSPALETAGLEPVLNDVENDSRMDILSTLLRPT